MNGLSRDDIIRMGWEASASQFLTLENIEALESFAALVAAAEREECALGVEQAGIEGYGTLAAAAIIRTRGNYAP